MMHTMILGGTGSPAIMAAGPFATYVSRLSNYAETLNPHQPVEDTLGNPSLLLADNLPGTTLKEKALNFLDWLVSGPGGNSIPFPGELKWVRNTYLMADGDTNGAISEFCRKLSYSYHLRKAENDVHERIEAAGRIEDEDERIQAIQKILAKLENYKYNTARFFEKLRAIAFELKPTDALKITHAINEMQREIITRVGKDFSTRVWP